MSLNRNAGFIVSSPSLGSGTWTSLLLIHIGKSHTAKTRVSMITHPVLRVYYLYANMTSLNSWRRSRGFSACPPLIPLNRILILGEIRHLCSPAALRGGRRPRSLDIRLPYFSLYLPRNLVTKGPCASIFVLPKADWNCNEPFE